MSAHRFWLSLVLFLAFLARGAAQQRDLRDQFGTTSLEAAKQIAQAIQLSNAKKHKDAQVAIEAALKADPRCQMAHYWRAIILGNLGEIPESMAAYKKCLSDDVRRSQNISANAAVNLAITYGKLDEFEESHRWFTRAIMEDFNNAARQRGKAYRNLGITLTRQGKHLAAAWSMYLAWKDGFPNVNEKMVLDAFEKGQDQEVASLLYFGGKSPKLEKRAQETKLAPVDLKTDIPELIADIYTDPQGRYLIALPRNAAHYYLIATADKVKVTKIEVPNPLVCACLADGALYAVPNGAARIDEITVETGKVARSYPLKNIVPLSLAVFPARGMAYFPASGNVHALSLKTGQIFRTEVPGEMVVAAPGQEFVFSSLKAKRNRWLQTLMMKSVAVPGGLLPASVRDNAASNGVRMQVSPDGNWVAVAGGGGWRPSGRQGGGYGVAVFSAHDLDQFQGFFLVDAYPQGVCFNPVTSQVTVIRGNDARIYHLSDTNTFNLLKGPFTGAGAWSGNGRFLALAQGGKGLALWENTLSADEARLAGTWWKTFIVKTTVAPQATFKPVEALARFVVKSPSRKELTAALARAAAEGRTDRPARWQMYPPYLKDDEMRKVIGAALRPLNEGTDYGIAIFQIKKALAKYPDSAPLKYFLAEAYRLGDQGANAEKFYQEVVQADSGRTELSCLALNRLAALLLARDQAVSALDCMAVSLYLDKANPAALSFTIPLLKKHKFDAEADQFTKLAAVLKGAAEVTSVELPKLAKPAAETKKYDPAEIYKKAVPSVVLIKTPNGSGSGVCVGRPDIILTNDHVVAGGGAITVTPFTYKDNALVRMPAIKAVIVFQSAKEDIAVLKLEKAPKHLQPLAVAAANPGTGARVYAIGSPGLGRQILEQSISEGIVGNNKRILEDRVFLQHTAAVNPGNSGGPLIDEKCQVVGIVTLKARLEKVSFAIPVSTLRAIFKSP
jgi:S1-C subfamily serine protease